MSPELDRVLPHEDWPSLHDEAILHTLVGQILARVGVDPGPMRGAAVVAVIAAALALPQASEHGWSCRWCSSEPGEDRSKLTRAYADQGLWLAGDGWRTHWFITDARQRPVAAFDLDGYIFVAGRPVVELEVSFPRESPGQVAERLLGRG